ncbi:MAG: ATP-binding protein [Magnetococcus sp. DMHC-1]|nr:HAMP domain-containing protein [Magnetococcales bacterium]
MKNPFPLSLAGQTVFILLVGLTFSHLLSILVFTSEKLEPMVLTSERRVLEHMATVTRLLLDIPGSLHEPVLATMNRSGLHFQVLPQTARDPLPSLPGNNKFLQHILAEMIQSDRATVVAVTLSEPDWNHRHGTLHRFLFGLEMEIIRLMHREVLDQELRAWVDLPAGQRIFLTTKPADNHVPLFRHATISVLVMTLAIFLFALVIARHTTRPLRRIAQAADNFGQDVHAAPLPEQGATEIVSVTRAFNRMQQKIHEFVTERLRMIAAISHDLRTPLTKLKLMAEFVGDAHTRSRMVATLNEMESMLAATLSFARDAVAVEPKQKINLGSLLVTITEDMADIGLAATCATTEKQPCLCRPLAMKRAFTNLIHNAVKYGGSAHISLTAGTDRLVIDIHDPGPGIPPDAWDHVCKPFVRLEPSRSPQTGGVGLGLAIASSVIRDHGGSIRFEHPPAGGFITRVELPRGTAPARSHPE